MRFHLHLQRTTLAKAIGITTQRLRNIESGKTALLYETALALDRHFAFGLAFLAGVGGAGHWERKHWPEIGSAIGPNAPSIGPETLFSEVAVAVLARPAPAEPPPSPAQLSEATRRLKTADDLGYSLAFLLSHVPVDLLDQCGEKVDSWLAGDCENWAHFPADVVTGNYSAMMAVASQKRTSQGRAESAGNLESPANAPNNNLNEALTGYREGGSSVPVQPILPVLIERLRRATAARGRKTELAAWLGVSIQRVTDWLSARVEPSGETTLRLLLWVWQAEHPQKQDGPGGAQTPPEPRPKS